MDSSQQRRVARERRHKRIRRRVIGTDSVPRLSVFRSNRHLYAQLISDESGRTLASVSSIKGSAATVTVDAAKTLGNQLAEKCKGLGVQKMVFDRAGYRYHGRIKALAEAVREAGLQL